ncbi:GTP-sensing pleiotropic transcriptional regulator CodY [Acidaminococcus fermentans]|jgi:GTP-sensing transcriptional pleiotropic repressor CodY|uniref:GTP-sensing pleiotropic transcriptional regulator CodY n=1 Tax=Acidaminococcus fermentans TaxID=905 RepID=UPI00241D3B4A|nr:GTP-sensing pleiotropic transcriptional regulator CodY [Acidaminococcus fermentans]
MGNSSTNVQLLDKTRKIEKLLHNNSTGKVVFNDICSVLDDILASNVLVLSRKGKVLGVGLRQDIQPIGQMLKHTLGDFIEPTLNERLLSVLSTNENVNLATLGFEGEDAQHNAIISPIEIAGERLGTVFIYNANVPYTIDDIIICEYGTTVVGLEMLRAVTEESAEENRKTQIVKSAISTLSYTEIQAILHIFEEMEGKREGILVASKIADKAGITRSVIVNALRKFESAGVIESRSSGMKGTYIKVLNDAVYTELDKMRDKVMA